MFNFITKPKITSLTSSTDKGDKTSLSPKPGKSSEYTLKYAARLSWSLVNVNRFAPHPCNKIIGFPSPFVS